MTPSESINNTTHIFLGESLGNDPQCLLLCLFLFLLFLLFLRPKEKTRYSIIFNKLLKYHDQSAISFRNVPWKKGQASELKVNKPTFYLHKALLLTLLCRRLLLDWSLWQHQKQWIQPPEQSQNKDYLASSNEYSNRSFPQGDTHYGLDLPPFTQDAGSSPPERDRSKVDLQIKNNTYLLWAPYPIVNKKRVISYFTPINGHNPIYNW